MSKRYTATGPWDVEADVQIDDYDGEQAGRVVTKSGPLRDDRTGTVYAEGAWNVTVDGPKGHPRSKTFDGESAWSNARRYADDAAYWIRRNA
jgi:hypothetical protein